MSSERRGGRNNKYSANICITKHDMMICRTTGSNAVLHVANGEGKHWKGFSRHLLFPDRRALTWYEEVLVKGETSGKVSPVFRVSDR